ncbi:MAG: redoxin domain-containing protein [Saprospiraceae bacterium]
MKIFLYFLFSSLVVSCSTKQPESKGETAPASAVARDAGPIPFPVYMTFEEFEPYIRFANDTTYVINFWATWCKPCVAELPYFEKLIQAYHDQPVKVYLVSMDFPKDIEKKLIPFVRERNLAPSVVALADMDYNSWIDKVSKDWDGAIPFTLIYNQKTRQTKLGEMDGYGELEGLVKAAMH